MTITVHDFRQYIVEPTLAQCAGFGVPEPPFAHDLLVATCAQESAMGRWLHQAGDGPALGVYQIEPASLHDLLKNFIIPSKKLFPLLEAVSLPGSIADDQLLFDLRFATVIARLFYYRVREPLPTDSSLASLWHYYKTYYNTSAGAATESSFVQALHAYTDIAVV